MSDLCDIDLFFYCCRAAGKQMSSGKEENTMKKEKNDTSKNYKGK